MNDTDDIIDSVSATLNLESFFSQFEHGNHPFFRECYHVGYKDRGNNLNEASIIEGLIQGEINTLSIVYMMFLNGKLTGYKTFEESCRQ